MSSKEKLAFVQRTLDKFDFVEWDRYTEYWDQEDRHNVKVYGWIEREKDGYKDFLTLWFVLDDKEVFSWQTSSEKYHDRIAEILGDERPTECKRVENLPINVKAIELGGGRP